ncbi:MAG: iron-containing alcohol dehydrogenase [Bacteroidota bacterium]|jgi:NADP-dependent alcohol dehydrogenase
MYNFEYKNPVKIIFGKDTISLLSKNIPSNSRVLMLYGGGSIFKNGVYEQVKSALKAFTFFEFGGIEPNPTYQTMMSALEIVRKEKIDFLLAVGGGSVVDGTKFLAAAANFDGEAWDICQKGAVVKSAIPIGVVLTLSATGTEMNPFSVVSHKITNEKLAFGSPHVYPKFSILDPNVLKTLPKSQLANGVVDAFVHVMEQYLTFPNHAEVQDRWAEGILLSLIDYGHDYVWKEFNYNVAANIMWAATMALNGQLSLGVPSDWATHTVGHELTALYGLDHGQSLAVILPGMMEVMRKEKHEKLIRYAKNVWKIEGEHDEIIIDEAIVKTEEFFRSLDLKTKLSEYNIPKSGIEQVIEKLNSQGKINLGEQKKLTPNRLRSLLGMRF